MGVWDDYDENATISEQLPNLRDGNYLLFLQGGSEFKSREGKFAIKIGAVVLKVTEDMGDSTPAGDETSVMIWRNPAYKFFEGETKEWLKACDNLDSKAANAKTKLEVMRFLTGTKKNPGSKLPGRVVEVQVRQIAEKKAKESDDEDEDEKPKKKKHKDPLRKVKPLRGLSRAEVMEAGISKKLLKRLLPKGPKSLVEPANAAEE